MRWTRRPILNYLFTFVCAASLALCTAAVVIWVRSYWIDDAYRFQYTIPGQPGTIRQVTVVSARGGALINIAQWRYSDGSVGEDDQPWQRGVSGRVEAGDYPSARSPF